MIHLTAVLEDRGFEIIYLMIPFECRLGADSRLCIGLFKCLLYGY